MAMLHPSMEKGAPGGYDDAQSHSVQEEEAAAGVQFSPPLYLQRYMLAVDYLTKHSIQTVVDFGCSECGFFPLLSTVASLQEISLVDIDRDLLMKRTRVISPELKDYINRRSNPLNVSMYAGSAGDFDLRMKDYEAVTLIESLNVRRFLEDFLALIKNKYHSNDVINSCIEHLYPDVLESVTHNVFGTIHPLHVIVTTPNAEFNVLFGNIDPTVFRHWDHKFEWTRSEFQEWCQNVCKVYGYDVEYSGVGFQPSIQKSSELGPCSQAAFFKRKKAQEMEVTEINLHVQELDGKKIYELIAKSEFPYDDNKMSKEEKLDMEIMYALRQIAHMRVEDYDDNLDDEGSRNISIKVKHLANRSHIKRLANVQEIREYLKQKAFDISSDGEMVTMDMSQFIDYSSDEDDSYKDYSDDDVCNGGHYSSSRDDGDDPSCGCASQAAGNRLITALETGDEEECWDTDDTSVT